MLVLNRIEFYEALKRVSIMSSQRSWGIRMELSEGKLKITSDNPDLGEADEEMDVDYQGEDLTVGFNARYFIDVIAEIEEQQVLMMSVSKRLKKTGRISCINCGTDSRQGVTFQSQ